MLEPKRGKVTVHKGIAYFHAGDVPSILPRLRVAFPELRAVAYRRGVALQVRISGDYIGPNLRPSMENAVNTFDRA